MGSYKSLQIKLYNVTILNPHLCHKKFTSKFKTVGMNGHKFST